VTSLASLDLKLFAIFLRMKISILSYNFVGESSFAPCLFQIQNKKLFNVNLGLLYFIKRFHKNIHTYSKRQIDQTD
jgi:hypothetical protein